MKKLVLMFCLIFVIFLVGCASQVDNAQDNVQNDVQDEDGVDWRDAELKDIRTGEIFKISDFYGKPILLESFAVWCPTCTKQQRKVEELHDEVGDTFVSISLDTDPNEDEERILEHLNTYGFKWRYAISPVNVTLSLIDEFGVKVVNAPAAPLILICGDGSAKLLGSRGVKSVEKLKEELASC